MVKFLPGWELNVDESDLYYEGYKYFYIIKEKEPNNKKDLNEVILDPQIILEQNEIITQTTILNKILALYPELVNAKLEVEQKNDIEWELRPTSLEQKYIGSVILYVTNFVEEEMPKLPVDLKTLIPDESFISVNESSEKGVLEAIYAKFADLKNRIYVSDLENMGVVEIYKNQIHLFEAIIKVNKNDPKYFGNTLVKYLWIIDQISI